MTEQIKDIGAAEEQQLNEAEAALDQVAGDLQEDIKNERSLLAVALGKDKDMFRSDKYKMWGLTATEILTVVGLAMTVTPLGAAVMGTTFFMLLGTHYLGAKLASESADFRESLSHDSDGAQS